MAAFTDHLAAFVMINLGDTRGHIVDKAYENLTVNCWLMNKEASASVVNGCARKKYKGSTWTVSWWDKCVKRNIRYFFKREGWKCSRIASLHKEFYLVCMYDILRNSRPRKNTLA